MNRAAPALLCLLALAAVAGCRAPDGRRPDAIPGPETVAPVSGEWQREQMHSYVEQRAEQLLASGRFASEDEAKAYARHEWSQRHNTARALSGEGYSSWSSDDARRARERAERDRFHRELDELDPQRP